MRAHDLSDSYDVDHWRNFRPDMTQYIKFSRDQANLILAGHKIEDIYRQYKMARASLMYLEVEDYGQLIGKNDDIHFAYIRSKFLFDALALYNYCIDLSWQMVYLYHGDAHFGAVQIEEYYIQASKDCDYESLKGRLVKVNKRDGLFDYIDKFFNDKLTNEIRQAYNYIKHRGTFHIEGLGLNEDSVPIGLAGYQLKMLNRKSINIEEWKEKLIQFDISFYNYFEDILKTLMPPGYLENTMSFEELVNTALNLEEWEKKRK